jgi:hypothetical protein
MKTVYVRASMRDSKSIKSRSMKALGFFCLKCRQFWTNEDVDKIIEEELREKQIEEEHMPRHNNTNNKLT